MARDPFKHMLRLLALLIICTVSFLMQGEPATAHENRLVLLQSIPESETVAGAVSTELSPANDCSSPLACCTMMCAPCQAPLASHRTGFLWKPVEASVVLAFRDECLRSIILGRDPPVPRPRFLQVVSSPT